MRIRTQRGAERMPVVSYRHARQGNEMGVMSS